MLLLGLDKKWDDKISWFRDFFVYNIIKLPWKLQLYYSWNISKDIALLDIKICAPIMSQPSVDHPHVSWRPIRLVIQHCMDHPLTPRPILMIGPSNQYHIKGIVNFVITKIYIYYVIMIRPIILVHVTLHLTAVLNTLFMVCLENGNLINK